MYGKTLVIVNPTARSGKATQVAAQTASALNHIKTKSPVALSDYTFHYTVKAKEAESITTIEGPNFDTILVIGGDGALHEVTNGLMHLPRANRPRLALIPCGNGDDFARTIGMNRDIKKSIQQLTSLTLTPKYTDVVRANSEWYLETLSFGVDAAIALGTQELRKTTKRTGTSLYIQCGIDQLRKHRIPRQCTLQLDNNAPQELTCYLLAVQNGVSYGGGFRVCPQAKLNDGLLDICYVTPPLSFMAATKLFMKAKDGHHTTDPHIHFEQASRITLSFAKPLPAQIDGEHFEDTQAIIEVFPSELEVYMPQKTTSQKKISAEVNHANTCRRRVFLYEKVKRFTIGEGII